MKAKNTIIFLIISLLTSLIQAQTETNNGKEEIYDRVWVLNRLNNKKILYKEGEERITLIITRENEYASGSLGCNTYVSQVVIKRNHILFRSIGSTKMACPDDKTTNERIYLSNLNDIDAFKIIDEDLYLYKNDRPVLVFSKE